MSFSNCVTIPVNDPTLYSCEEIYQFTNDFRNQINDLLQEKKKIIEIMNVLVKYIKDRNEAKSFSSNSFLSQKDLEEIQIEKRREFTQSIGAISNIFRKMMRKSNDPIGTQEAPFSQTPRQSEFHSTCLGVLRLSEQYINWLEVYMDKRIKEISLSESVVIDRVKEQLILEIVSYTMDLSRFHYRFENQNECISLFHKIMDWKYTPGPYKKEWKTIPTLIAPKTLSPPQDSNPLKPAKRAQQKPEATEQLPFKRQKSLTETSTSRPLSPPQSIRLPSPPILAESNAFLPLLPLAVPKIPSPSLASSSPDPFSSSSMNFSLGRSEAFAPLSTTSFSSSSDEISEPGKIPFFERLLTRFPSPSPLPPSPLSLPSLPLAEWEVPPLNSEETLFHSDAQVSLTFPEGFVESFFP